MSLTCTEVVGTGSVIPEQVVKNDYFYGHVFVDIKGNLHVSQSEDKHLLSAEEIVKENSRITEIGSRRYFLPGQKTSEMGLKAAEIALETSGVDPETLDRIIFAHNFGDVNEDGFVDTVPSLSSRVKERLKIKNRETHTQDLTHGCPGWLEGVIYADQQIKGGYAKTVLVIGAECLSRVSDPHDRDSLIYADGAAAAVFRAVKRDQPFGVLNYFSVSDANHASFLTMGPSNMPGYLPNRKFLKMIGHKVFIYAKTKVPGVAKECLDRSGLRFEDISQALIHQANGKLDYEILNGLYHLCHPDFPESEDMPRDLAAKLMPMTISWLGNSSVATIPTLLDLVLRGKMEGHSLDPEQYILFASVGAGMNSNALSYKMPPKD